MREGHPLITWSANYWVVSSALLPALTFGISYPLAYSEGNLPRRGGAFFPSDSINEWPDRAIGTFGLGLTAWCLSHLFYYHYLFLCEMIPDYRKSTFALLGLGELCAFFVFGIGAIQTGICPFWHSFCAYNSFIGINIYINISTWFMDRLVRQKDLTYRRGNLRIFSAIGGPIMFFLHLSPLTRGSSSSLAEIGLLACFLLWIVSQFNVWGKVYLTYADSPESSKVDDYISEYMSLKYKRMSSSSASQDSLKAERRCDNSSTVVQLSADVTPPVKFVETRAFSGESRKLWKTQSKWRRHWDNVINKLTY